MGKLLSFFDRLIDLFIGWNIRHNRALRDITDLRHSIGEFVAEYGQPADVLSNIGQARVDITTVTHQIRTKMKVVKHIRGKKLAPLIEQLYNSLEAVREDIYSTKRGNRFLGEDLSKLNSSLQVLTDSISDIKYR